MPWLTMHDATQRGIDVNLFSPAPTKPPPAPQAAIQESGSVGANLELRTKEFVASLFAAWSSNDLKVASLDALYADQVDYYGKTAHRPSIVADKRKFMERWPQRRYTVRETSTVAHCNDKQICTLIGSIDWASFNPTTLAGARGIADIQYGISWSGDEPKIVLETSKVLNRQQWSPAARRPGTGWWIVLGSFRDAEKSVASLVEQSVGRATGAAYLCGFDTISDHSSKFAGFAPGYQVVVIGAFEKKSIAEDARRQLAPCMPEAYLKQASYSGG